MRPWWFCNRRHCWLHVRNKHEVAAKGSRSRMATSAKKGLVVRSAEGRRLGGLKKLPAVRRAAAVSKFLASAK